VSIAALSHRPGWYTAPLGELQAIAGKVPGLTLGTGGVVTLHQSHLPLLADHPDAPRHLLRSTPHDWAARDAATRDRGFTLRPAQHAAVDFITRRRGTLLGDDMRVGKTLSAIMSHDPATGPLLVICPAMVRSVWIGWLARVFPGVPVGIMMGRKFDATQVQQPLIVGHYDILPYWETARPFGTVVFDEAHWLSNPRTRRTMAAVLVANRAHRVIAATGTPIWNMPSGLWSVLGLIAPGAWGSFHEFAQRYGNPEPTAYGTVYTGISHEQELRARLAEVMIRRRWADVQAGLPPISRNVILTAIDTKTRRQLDVAATAISDGKGSTIGLLARYREHTSMLKLATTVTEARTMLDRGEPVVVWTWHVALANAIAAELGDRARLLTGEVAPRTRDQLVDAWRGDAPASALVCTMAVAQVGLDFSHARLAIFAECDYTPATMAQAEMRTFSPLRAMNVTYVVADHMVDQRVVLALVKKLDATLPLSLESAAGAISVLHEALRGPVETPDMDRLLAALLDD